MSFVSDLLPLFSRSSFDTLAVEYASRSIFFRVSLNSSVTFLSQTLRNLGSQASRYPTAPFHLLSIEPVTLYTQNTITIPDLSNRDPKDMHGEIFQSRIRHVAWMTHHLHHSPL
jgi:hypothetical protein